MNLFAIITQVLRIAVPYLFAAAGGVIAERSGIISLTLEGYMLGGAFAAVVGTFYSGDPYIGALCGIAGGTRWPSAPARRVRVVEVVGERRTPSRLPRLCRSRQPSTSAHRSGTRSV